MDRDVFDLILEGHDPELLVTAMMDARFGDDEDLEEALSAREKQGLAMMAMGAGGVLSGRLLPSVAGLGVGGWGAVRALRGRSKRKKRENYERGVVAGRGEAQNPLNRAQLDRAAWDSYKYRRMLQGAKGLEQGLGTGLEHLGALGQKAQSGAMSAREYLATIPGRLRGKK